MVGLIALGSSNFVVLKILYSSYGERFAYFVSQGVNALYLFFGALVLVPLLLFTDEITAADRSAPGLWKKFVIMGALDCGGALSHSLPPSQAHLCFLFCFTHAFRARK